MKHPRLSLQTHKEMIISLRLCDFAVKNKQIKNQSTKPQANERRKQSNTGRQPR